jgi:hypothetical protein
MQQNMCQLCKREKQALHRRLLHRPCHTCSSNAAGRITAQTQTRHLSDASKVAWSNLR